MADGAQGSSADCNDQKGAQAHEGGATSWAANFVGDHFGQKPEAKACPADNPSTAGDVAQNIINHKGLGPDSNAAKIAEAFQKSGKTLEDFTRDVNAELERRHSSLRVNEKLLTGNDADNRGSEDLKHAARQGLFPESQNVGSVDYDPHHVGQRSNRFEASEARDHKLVVIAVNDTDPNAAKKQEKAPDHGPKALLPKIEVPPDL